MGESIVDYLRDASDVLEIKPELKLDLSIPVQGFEVFKQEQENLSHTDVIYRMSNQYRKIVISGALNVSNTRQDS